MATEKADDFLRMIRRSQRGRLKIYLGYAAGVGKTYQMLLEAHRLKDDGINVVVGVVETHGRTETEKLLQGLEIIPRRKIVHRGIEIEDMDTEEIIARRPSVVLIDELAHTNMPGSRNDKRYEDIEEIIASGIHVISTLNVQHLESLYETVEGITGVKVRERVPDRIVTEADQIVNVDVTTEDLQRRLKEGKVYTRERIETALDHFFKPANLEQLRELTLRELAAQIDSRRRDVLTEDIPSTPDQVMVCLSSGGPNTEALLRYASRLAGRLNRNWYAVYVQMSRENPEVIDSGIQRILSNNMTLAKQLGATIFTYKGDDIVRTILQFAKEYRVGHIVLGTPGRKPSFWRRMLRGPGVVERLINESKGRTIVILDTRTMQEKEQTVSARSDNEPFHPIVQPERAPFIEKEAILSKRSILIWDKSLDKEAAMRQLLNVCLHDKQEIKESAWNALLEREQQGGTYVGEDVAIPHVRIPGLVEPFIALGIGKSGIMDRDSGRSFKVMILLLSPAVPPETHVAMLGMIARMVRDDQWRRSVLFAERPDDVFGIIREESINVNGGMPISLIKLNKK
jgi:two-component system, OmpR family, sensor histidine kinase KdpD